MLLECIQTSEIQLQIPQGFPEFDNVYEEGRIHSLLLPERNPLTEVWMRDRVMVSESHSF